MLWDVRSVASKDKMVISSRYALRFLHSSLTHVLTHYRKNIGAPVGQIGLKYAPMR